MKRQIAVAVGVGDAPPLPYLSGAINGARSFHEWASRLGYSSKLVIDDETPVTIERLRSELSTVLTVNNEPIHRLLLYFAGHGLIREAEEGLWLLSDWYKELRAVAVETLKRRLSMYYNIQQIAIFADSCRSLPPDIEAADLAPDPVLGRGPYRSPAPPTLDKFVAAQDGAETFMVPGNSPEEDRCLFSGLLVEGLWGAHPDAFSKILKGSITSRSLGAFLQSAVPTLASRYELNLVPSVSPTFPEGDDIYLEPETSLTPPVFPEWPPLDVFKRTMGIRGIKGVLGASSGIGYKRGGIASLQTPGEELVEQIHQQQRLRAFDTGAGFVIQSGLVRAVWTPRSLFAERHGYLWQIGHRSESPRLQHSAPVLIEFDDGMFAALTALPNFVADVIRDQRGISALVYRPDWEDKAPGRTEAALASMENGNLRTDQLITLAVGLRQEKHCDPVLGAISAYLYDAIGDIGSIHRMAYYYTLHGQPIPYDIALLGLLTGERRDERLWVRVPPVQEQKPRTEAEQQHEWTFKATPETWGEVGGLWPWLRQGWIFLDEPLDDRSPLIDRGLIQLTRCLKPGRFATLDSEGGRRIADLFNLSPNENR
jgi:hypothetical protein